MKGSVTRLIYKKQGDIENLKNWRLISLLNVDYKILSKVITARLSRVLHIIIDSDRTCSVPGRSIFSNIFLIQDVLDYIELTDETAIMVWIRRKRLKDFVSLRNLFEVISIYKAGSGAKLNKSKTEAMWLGAWRNRSDEPLGLTWVRKMKILGVVFGTIPVEQENWQPKLNKLEKSLNLWKSRSLSFIGKSLIVNVLGLSKFIYLAKTLIMLSGFFPALIS